MIKCQLIGDNVPIECNVCIIGGVKIGNDVDIGAGAVVPWIYQIMNYGRESCMSIIDVIE